MYWGWQTLYREALCMMRGQAVHWRALFGRWNKHYIGASHREWNSMEAHTECGVSTIHGDVI